MEFKIIIKTNYSNMANYIELSDREIGISELGVIKKCLGEDAEKLKLEEIKGKITSLRVDKNIIISQDSAFMLNKEIGCFENQQDVALNVKEDGIFNDATYKTVEFDENSKYPICIVFKEDEEKTREMAIETLLNSYAYTECKNEFCTKEFYDSINHKDKFTKRFLDKIDISWNVDDINQVIHDYFPEIDITKMMPKDYDFILRIIDGQFDANYGIDWGTIKIAINTWKQETKEQAQRYLKKLENKEID